MIHIHARPVVAAKGKKNEKRVSANKRKTCENQYDKPVIAVWRKQNEGQESVPSKQEVCEHYYDKPVVAAKRRQMRDRRVQQVNKKCVSISTTSQW